MISFLKIFVVNSRLLIYQLGSFINYPLYVKIFILSSILYAIWSPIFYDSTKGCMTKNLKKPEFIY